MWFYGKEFYFFTPPCSEPMKPHLFRVFFVMGSHKVADVFSLPFRWWRLEAGLVFEKTTLCYLAFSFGKDFFFKMT